MNRSNMNQGVMKKGQNTQAKEGRQERNVAGSKPSNVDDLSKARRKDSRLFRKKSGNI